MKEYHIDFGIEVYAESPEAAAAKAWEYLQRLNLADGVVSAVTEIETGDRDEIDLPPQPLFAEESATTEDTCDKCGAKIDTRHPAILCPDGSEICQHCFAYGAS